LLLTFLHYFHSKIHEVSKWQKTPAPFSRFLGHKCPAKIFKSMGTFFPWHSKNRANSPPPPPLVYIA
jgi:hypothetical protein